MMDITVGDIPLTFGKLVLRFFGYIVEDEVEYNSLFKDHKLKKALFSNKNDLNNF